MPYMTQNVILCGMIIIPIFSLNIIFSIDVKVEIDFNVYLLNFENKMMVFFI